MSKIGYAQQEPLLCLECGESIGQAGRLDRKFCCSECKSKYHYRTQRATRSIRTRAMAKLDRNHEVLESLLKLGVSSISSTEASIMGIDLDYMTSCRILRGHMECTCYDISYRLTTSRISHISKCLSTFDADKF